MPLSLTYLPGLVSGPTSILILPILGWLMDRGDNPVCRRITSIIFVATLQTLGILCLLSANFLQFRYLLNYNATRTSVNTVTTTTTASLNDTGFLDWAVGLDVVLAVVAALHRTCHYTMPFAVTNDIAQDIVSTGSGRSPVGLAMSLVAASIPLSYCALFSWAGAVEQLTGDVSAPLWMGSAAGVLAVIAFLFVGKV
ncbi:hypothetical protein ACOMHN_062510 [Nucella lapillus]